MSRKELCAPCSAIFELPNRPQDDELQPHHAAESSFWDAVKDGCYMCSSLAQETGRDQTQALSDQVLHRSKLKYSFTGELGDANASNFEVTLYFLTYAIEHDSTSSEKPLSTSKARFWLQPHQDGGEIERTSSALNGPSTFSKPAMALAASWLRNCKQQHRRCSGATTRPAFVPTRLVDLKASETDDTIVRVIEPNDTPIDEPYMTLSHRWGTQQFPMFTERNRASMKHGFCLRTLPQTFQEAIQVARYFNIRYLWIDCLCILQGSASDFECEAGLMHRVYGNSYCNICATGASNNFEPLFSLRNEGKQPQVNVDLRWENNPNRTYALIDAQLWKHGVFLRPVNTRSWVMQERFLAPCVLHFGTDQLYWECQELHACENYPAGLPSAVTYGAYDLKTIDLPREADLDMSPQLRVYKLWCVLLHTYTRCGITQAQDKLIALAGIATRVHETLQDQYLAGIWRSWLMYDLCWHVDFTSQGKPAQRLDFYRAPSWSGASMEGPVNLGGSVPIHPSASLACEVLGVGSEPISKANPFGAVRTAKMTIRGRLAQFTVRDDPLLKSSPVEWHRMSSAGAARFSVNEIPIPRMGIAAVFDNALATPPDTGIWCFAVRREEHEVEDLCSDLKEDAALGTREPASILGGSDPQGVSPTRGDCFAYGLLITAAFDRSCADADTAPKSNGTQRECFQRIGYFTLGGNDVVDTYDAACANQDTIFTFV